MIKIARKPSSDPLQEKLRQNKALWNKDISDFIGDLINLKKTMNGWPSKFFQEKSFIKDPIPADPVTILGVLSNDFQELVQKGNSIIKEQLEYSKTRRKKQVKTPGQSTTSNLLENTHATALVLDMIKVASVFEEKYELKSEASNSISRFFAKILNPTIGFSEAARIRRVRMQLLKSSANVYKKLEKFQVAIVKSSQASIDTSNDLMHEAWRDWETIRTGFNTYKSMMPKEVIDVGGDIAPSKVVVDIKNNNKEEEKNKEENKSKILLEDINTKMDSINKAIENGKAEPDDADYDKQSKKDLPDLDIVGKNIMNDLREQEVIKLANWVKSDFEFALRNIFIFSDAGIDTSIFNELAEYIKNFSIRAKWAPMVIQSHKKTIDYLNSNLKCVEKSYKDIIAILKSRESVQDKINQQKKNLEDLLDKAKQKALLTTTDATLPTFLEDNKNKLEVTAQAFLKKWIGKTRHQMSMFDETSTQRLQIFDVAEEMMKTVDQIMDHLEKDINVSELSPMIDKANREMSTIRSLTRNLYQINQKNKKI